MELLRAQSQRQFPLFRIMLNGSRNINMMYPKNSLRIP